VDTAELCRDEAPEISSQELSSEQKARIERNREVARERLKKRIMEESSNEEPTTPPPTDKSTFGGFAMVDGQPKSKRAKHGKESAFMTDLKNVCSEGSVVRIQGTKLIDTGGGFLIEEGDFVEQEEEEKVLTVQPAAFIPTDTPLCEECGVPFSDSYLLLTFDYAACDTCKYVKLLLI
jgi:hypothetical protein